MLGFNHEPSPAPRVWRLLLTKEWAYRRRMSESETELEMVQRHVREGERQVATQRDILAHLRNQRYPAELAEQLLTNLEDSLLLHRRHLAQLTTDEGR